MRSTSTRPDKADVRAYVGIFEGCVRRYTWMWRVGAGSRSRPTRPVKPGTPPRVPPPREHSFQQELQQGHRRRALRKTSKRKDKEMNWARVLVSAAIGIVFTFSSAYPKPAQAQTAQQSHPISTKCQKHFDALDKNHDGVVTKEEFMAVKHLGHDPEKVLASKDLNGDGQLTKEEYCLGTKSGKKRDTTPSSSEKSQGQ